MSNLFNGISEEDARLIRHNLDISQISLKAGSDLLDLLPPGRFLGVVEEGQIDVLRTDSAGNSMLLFSGTEGSVLGPYYMRGNRGEISITARTRSVVTIVDYSLFSSVNRDVELYALFNRNLLDMMIVTDRSLNERTAVIMQKSIRTKLLEYFRQETRKISRRQFTMPFTFTFLADWLSVDRSAMQRELKNLKEEGFIRIKGRTVTVLEGTDSSVYNRFGN